MPVWVDASRVLAIGQGQEVVHNPANAEHEGREAEDQNGQVDAHDCGAW